VNPIRRELLNGLLVLVVASLLSVAFSAFQVSFDVHLWVLILMGLAIAISVYVMFEMALRYMASTEDREKEWLKRVGNPALLAGGPAMVSNAVKAMRPGSDLTLVMYLSSEGGTVSPLTDKAREEVLGTVMEQLQRGTIREYKRILCFDPDVLANDHELKSGILRVGEKPGTVNRHLAAHCRLMLETKGCFLYVAPAVLRQLVILFGPDKAALGVERFDQDTGARRMAGVMFFYDPPNAEIIEQFRQLERETERRMVAVHKIVFPEDTAATAETASR
jgi:hypothetical protein